MQYLGSIYSNRTIKNLPFAAQNEILDGIGRNKKEIAEK